MMRRVLVDEARKRQADKRGAGAPRIPLSEAPAPSVAPGGGLLELDEAMTRLEFRRAPELGGGLRYFGGLSFEKRPTPSASRPRAPGATGTRPAPGSTTLNRA